MRRSRFDEAQIRTVVHSLEQGESIEAVRRELGVSLRTLYRWRKVWGSSAAVQQTRELQAARTEIARLEQVVQSQAQDIQTLLKTLCEQSPSAGLRGREPPARLHLRTA